MTGAIGIFAFVVALLVSVMLHEAGHFLFARRFGMKATQFFVGFGRTLWSTRRGETEYGVKAIPAGGFVKIVGMTPLEEVEPQDERRAFWRQPAPARLVVLAAGSVVHFVIAFVLIWVVLVPIGVPGKATTTVATVAACVPADGATTCSSSDLASPAKVAGLREGDRVVSFQGRPVESWDELTRQIRSVTSGPQTLLVERSGEQVALTVTPAVRKRESLEDPSRTEAVGVLGITPSQGVERLGPVEGAGRSATTFWRVSVETVKALAKVPASIPKLVDQTVNGTTRSADGLVGPVGVARVSGQALEGSSPLYDRIGFFLLIIAGLNVTVGIFNLLPLLPMDGGHIAVLLFEQARTAVYRLIGRRDPGRVDLTKLMPVAYLVLVLLVGLSLLLLAADILNPVQISL